MHGHTSLMPPVRDPRAARIAALSTEYLDAGPVRREAIGDEIAALIEERIAVLDRSRPD